jgi:hypothetical protein
LASFNKKCRYRGQQSEQRCCRSGALLLLLSLLLPPAALIAITALVAGFLLPSRKALEAREAVRCQSLARLELTRRLQEFKAAEAKLEPSRPSRHDVDALLKLRTTLRLTEDEIGAVTIERLKGLASVLEFEAAVLADEGRLPTLSGHDAIVAPGACYFVSAATYDKRGDNDPSGSLYLSTDRLIFLATEGLTTADWEKVMSVDEDDHVLRVQRRDRKTPYLFLLPTIGEAMKAQFIARNLLSALHSAAIQSADAALQKPSAAASSTPKPTIDLGSGHGYTIGIVGESYRQTALRNLAGDQLREGKPVRFVATLTPEPENAYDANAVRINADGGEHLGYLSREDALAYRDVLSSVSGQGALAVCQAKLIGGTNAKPSIGVMLDLRDPKDLIAILSNEQAF